MVKIIIPCYNEAGRFKKELFFDYVDRLAHLAVAFVLVNDGSTDSTDKLLDDIKSEVLQRKPQIPIHLVKLPKNVGKAEAVRQGMLFALPAADTHFVAYFDADFSTPLTEVLHLLAAINNDSRRKFILGSRIKKAGARIERSLLRHVTGRIFATVVNNTVLKIAVYDTQCGAKLFTAACARDLFAEPFVSRWLFDIELITRLQRQFPVSELRHTIYEQPLEVWKEMGDSKIKFKDLVRMPYQLFLIHKNQQNGRNKNLEMG